MLILAAFTAAIAVTAVPAAAAPPSGSVTIVTKIDFTEPPFHGTFKVTEGRDILGCSGGTFVDSDNGFGGIDKAFTCSRGGSGTFTANAHPCAFGFDEATSSCSGIWAIKGSESTGDFAGLYGRGDFFVVIDFDRLTGVETLTGTIGYAS
jgi:hypothetical protein